MKKIYPLICFVLFTLFSASSFAQGIWTWMSGDTVQNGAAVFGTQGVPLVSNHPQACYSSFCWTDKQGNFWLYGGSTPYLKYYGDLWKFNPSTLEWTWVKGNGAEAPAPVYGIKGVANINNTPGGRFFSSCTWVDTSGNLWLYGGMNTAGLAADLWMYNIATNMWTWVSGSSSDNLQPVYGTMGVASALNYPGSRQEAGNGWVDAKGKLWMYGSDVYNIPINYARSDIWMYDPVTNMWTWESGPQTKDPHPVYGTKGVFAAGNSPGGRRPQGTWMDAGGHFFVFGGNNVWYDTCYADLWEYDPSINQWAWINGSKTISAVGIAGTSCQCDSSFFPDGRDENKAVWRDNSGNAWMYGGDTGTRGLLGDMWEYISASKKWARVTNSNNANADPVFGTMGIPSASNMPGCRKGTGHWKDNQGNFWLFGGDAGMSGQSLSDMWRYAPDLNCVQPGCGGCQSSAGVIFSSHDSVCAGSGASSQLTATNTIGTLQWQSSVDSTNYSNISGETSNSYSTSTSLTQSTYYRVIANGGICSDTSASKKITVFGASFAGTITSNPDSLCTGALAKLKASGSKGSIQWQSSITTSNFQNIAGATDSSLTQIPSQTTYYRTVSVNGICSDTSAPFVLTITPGANAGIISSTQDSICTGSSISSELSTSNSVGGLQWQSSVNGISYVNISGATSSSYIIASTPTQSTYYRLIANGGTCSDTSAAKKITILSVSLAGVISSYPDSLCTGTLAKLKASGSKGSIQWQSSATTSNFRNISGATDSSLTQVPTQTTYYRTISVNEICPDTSSLFKLTVIPIPVASFTTSDLGLVVTFNSSGSSGGVTSYYWNFGDGDTSNLANPVHTYSKADTFDVCLTVFNRSNCDYTTCFNVEVYPTGIMNISAGNKWNIYPDPFTNEFNIVSATTIPIHRIEIYNVLGEMVLNTYTNLQDNVYRIDASGLPNGMYFVRIKTQDSNYTVPIVKQ